MSSVEEIDAVDTNDNHTSTPPPNQRIIRSNTGRIQMPWKDDPWTPIVLSLDGGGIRGLSELFILRQIMTKVQELIEREGNDPTLIALQAQMGSQPEGSQASSDTASPQRSLLLPCYFFDYMIGTSTGGLISVMLGRLRMSIDECIKAYWRLGNKVFKTVPRGGSTSAGKLKSAILDVVRENCGCNPQGGRYRWRADKELLRQHDYSEGQDVDDIHYKENEYTENHSCKVGVVAMRKENGLEATHLFRSYNHSPRFSEHRSELNPGTLASEGGVKIWEACYATSAAPSYFPSMQIGPDEFIDGGAGNNNPSTIAWNEAKWMSNYKNPHNGDVALLVSLGCGEKRQGTSLFGVSRTPLGAYKAYKRGKDEITKTREAHTNTENVALSNNSAYFRFDVPQGEGIDGHRGLRIVKTCECKRERKISLWKSFKEKLPKFPTSSSGSSSSDATEPIERPEWYSTLEQEAGEHLKETRKGGFKPEKYKYLTYDTIFQLTESYCVSQAHGQDVARKIEECASALLHYARARQADDAERWRRFVSHPNPEHPSHL